MYIPRAPHRWSVTPKRAIAIQTQLASAVRHTPVPHRLRLVAGLDAAFSPDERHCIAAVVLWDLCEHTVVEQHTAMRRLTFPYIPGLLSFREAPAVLAGLRKLKTRPDVLLCDGHGVAHPRRFGIASHIGVIAELPTIGCAKSRLIGASAVLAPKRGSIAPLVDRGEVVGSVLRTQDGVNPVFVSVGHNIDLRSAEHIVLICATRYRLPEPTRLADQLVAAVKRQVMLSA
jgi:deoxyribonuclease V